jgi:hypothetical protein
MRKILKIIQLFRWLTILVIDLFDRKRLAPQSIYLADDVAKALRRQGVALPLSANPLNDMYDPKIAAGGVLFAIAALDGALTVERLQAIKVEFTRLFNATMEEAADLLIIGRWLVGQHGYEEALRCLAMPLHHALVAGEIADFLVAARAVAEDADGTLDHARAQAIEEMRSRLA